MRVAVVGAGVSGLSCAAELASLASVTVFHDMDLLKSTSAVATAIWHVYLVDPGDGLVLKWAERTLVRLCELEGHPETGVDLIEGVELFRRSFQQRPVWADAALNFSMLEPLEISRSFPGATWGYRLSAPVANMAKYLPWLMSLCTSRGVDFRRERVASLEALSGFDVVVNCAGLRSRDLLVDQELFGVKGQYLVLKSVIGAPIDTYVGDDEHPKGMAYMIPRDGEILVGGTEEMSEDLNFDVDVAGILERAGEFCRSDMAGASVVREVVGVRPCRRSGRVAFGWDLENPAVFHNYGHGGSGFSLSWGCAEAVVDQLLGG